VEVDGARKGELIALGLLARGALLVVVGVVVCILIEEQEKRRVGVGCFLPLRKEVWRRAMESLLGGGDRC